MKYKAMILPKSFFDTTAYFGISIDASSVRAVSVSSQGKAISYGRVPLANFDPSADSDAKPLAQAFEKIKQQGGFTSPYVAVVLPENQAFSKQFSLPNVTLAEFSEAIIWQINDIFPFPEDEIYIDWKILKKTDDEIEALVVAVKKHKIDIIRKALASAGLFPVSFETSVSSLSKISQLTSQGLTILVDVNMSDIAISLIEEGVPLLTTTKVTANQTQDLASTIDENIQSLLKYYEEKRNQKPAGANIVVTGDRANQDFVKTLQSKTGNNTSLLDIENINPGFHQAYAAAISHIEPPEDTQTINLLPEDLRAWYKEHYHEYLHKKAIKIQGLSLAIGVCAFAMSGIILNAKIRQVENISINTANIEADGQNASEIVKKANRIALLFPEKTGPQEELLEALQLVPSGIKVENITYESSKKLFQLVGVATERKDLIALKESIEKSEKFTNVVIPISQLVEQKNINFSIEFNQK